VRGDVPGVLVNVAPEGRGAAVIVRVCAGVSESVQLTVKLSNVSSSTALLPMAARTGGVFAATLIVTVLVSDMGGLPLSVQTKVTVKLMPFWAAVGVNENVPITGDVPGVLVNDAPVGRPVAAIVNVFAGMSESVQVTVKVKVLPTDTDWGDGGTLRLGATFTSLTVMTTGLGPAVAVPSLQLKLTVKLPGP